MPRTLVCDIRHWIDGDPAETLPRGLLRRRAYLGHIISAATTVQRPLFISGITCARRPRRQPCDGVVMVETGDDTEPYIYWTCLACGDNGRISGFRGSWYDMGRYRNRRGTGETFDILLTRDEYAAMLTEEMTPYGPGALRAIYSAQSDGNSVALSGTASNVGLLIVAVTADANLEKGTRRRALLRSVREKLRAAAG